MIKNKEITLECYEICTTKGARVNNLKEWIETPEPEGDSDDIYEGLNLYVGPFDRKQIKKLLETEKLVPFTISQLVTRFLADLADEDTTAMVWYYKYVSEMLKISIKSSNKNEIIKSNLIEEIKANEQKYGNPVDIPFTFEPLERMSLSELYHIKYFVDIRDKAYGFRKEG